MKKDSLVLGTGVITDILFEEFKCLAPNFTGGAKSFLNEQFYFKMYTSWVNQIVNYIAVLRSIAASE